MTLRIRTRAYGPSYTGTFVRRTPWDGWSNDDEWTSVGSQVTTDNTGSTWDAFETKSCERVGSTITGRNDFPPVNGKAWYSEFSNYPSLIHGQEPDYYVETPDMDQLILAALAKNNPNDGEGNLTNMLIEAAELPQLVKQFGTEAFKALFKRRASIGHLLANYNLAFQFGILPMVSDFMKLNEFQKNVDAKIRTLKEVREHGGHLVKKVRLGQYSADRSSNGYMVTNGAFISGFVQNQSFCDVWAAIQYSYDESLDLHHLMDPAYDRETATNFALGHYSVYDIADLWEVLPFSWLVDYFANIGKVAKATNNQLGLVPTKGILMKKTQVFASHDEYRDGNIICSPGGYTAVRKHRQPFTPKVTSNMLLKKPMISANQVGILGSLAVLFASKWKNGGLGNPYIGVINRLL